MPHKTRPMTALLLFTGLNVVLVSTITPVYDFVCFLPYWERRRERRHDAWRGKQPWQKDPLIQYPRRFDHMNPES